jgi:hypothetical protein
MLCTRGAGLALAARLADSSRVRACVGDDGHDANGIASVTMPNHLRELQPSDGTDPPHATDPTGAVDVRYTEPPGVLLQLVRPARGTTEMAEWVTETGLTMLFARFPHSRDLRVILDMRLMTGRSASARALLIQAGMRCVGRVGHVVLIPSQQLGAAYLAVVEAAAALVRSSGLRVDIEHDLQAVLARHAVQIARSEAPPRPSN